MILKEFKIRGKTLKNRIAISPMCQYSANKSGNPSKWHHQHLSKLMSLGAGMLVVESTAINPEGRISSKDLVISRFKQISEYMKLVKRLKDISDTKIIIQLSHSGRKGSSEIPWIKNNTPIKNKEKKWQTFSASAIKKDKKWPLPKSLKANQIKKIVKDFVKSAKYALKSNFDGIEIHMAHGYLLHQFLSPISNKRKDQYGGSLKNRCKLPLEIVKEISKILPKNKFLGARITGTDHLKGGINLNEAIYLAKELRKLKLDYVCVSSGGILTKTNMKFAKGFRLKFSRSIKRSAKILTRTSCSLGDLSYSNKKIKSKEVDFIAIGREFISNPSLVFDYAKKKNYKKKLYIPNQYLRCFEGN